MFIPLILSNLAKNLILQSIIFNTPVEYNRYLNEVINLKITQKKVFKIWFLNLFILYLQYKKIYSNLIKNTIMAVTTKEEVYQEITKETDEETGKVKTTKTSTSKITKFYSSQEEFIQVYLNDMSGLMNIASKTELQILMQL